jgi:hypothetical protein
MKDSYHLIDEERLHLIEKDTLIYICCVKKPLKSNKQYLEVESFIVKYKANETVCPTCEAYLLDRYNVENRNLHNVNVDPKRVLTKELDVIVKPLKKLFIRDYISIDKIKKNGRKLEAANEFELKFDKYINKFIKYGIIGVNTKISSIKSFGSESNLAYTFTIVEDGKKLYGQIKYQFIKTNKQKLILNISKYDMYEAFGLSLFHGKGAQGTVTKRYN